MGNVDDNDLGKNGRFPPYQSGSICKIEPLFVFKRKNGLEMVQEQEGTVQEQVATVQERVATVQEQVGTVQEQVETVQEQVETVQEQVETTPTTIMIRAI